VPTTQNPTLEGEDDNMNDLPVEDVIDDIFHEPTPNGQGGWVDDGTGIHPTPTTYSSITVSASNTDYPTEYATPTPSSYHLEPTDEEVADYNTYLGARNLRFVDESRLWSQYTPTGNLNADGYYSNLEAPWVSGLRLRYSWDYISGVTANEYQAIAPMMVFFTGGSSPKTAYYFFVEIFNDFQSHYGFDNYKYWKDGYPSATWPGVIPVVRSVIGRSQRPIERDLYETWVLSKLGSIKYVAPYAYPVSYMSTSSGRPTRFATVATPTVVTRDISAPPDSVDSTVAGFVSDDAMDLTNVTSEVAALQASAVASAVAAQAATDAAALTVAVNAAMASGAVSQQQALAAQVASDAAAQATAVANQKNTDAAAQAQALAAAQAAGQTTLQQAVAAQAAADSAAQSAALASQAAADSAAQLKAVASAVAAQAATDSTQQAAAVAAQAASDTAAQKAAVAAAVAQQSATDATSLSNAVAAQAARDAKLYTMPAFAAVAAQAASTTYSGTLFQTVTSMTTMDYTHVWLPAFTGWYDKTSAGVVSYSSLAAAQAAAPTYSDIMTDGTSYFNFASISVFQPCTGGLIRNSLSGWLRAGTSTQMVGWLFASNSTTGLTFVCTGYGYTSVAPKANSGETGYTGNTYTLKTTSVQSEILSHMTLPSAGQGVTGFIYDASVGSYGQVTWISQI
jgi:hypothetical protein